MELGRELSFLNPPLSGTNVENAKQLLVDSGLPIQAAEDFGDVAQKAVQSLSS